MSNKNSNFPTNQLNQMNGQDFIGEYIDNLMQLKNKGKPKSDEEVKERIDDYFGFCVEKNFRCGIESLCLALSISRTTLFQWANGRDCSKYRTELIISAKQVIISFLEAATMNGKINPASSIFYLKNWANYTDTIKVEQEYIRADPLSIDEMPTLEIEKTVDILTDD